MIRPDVVDATLVGKILLSSLWQAGALSVGLWLLLCVVRSAPVRYLVSCAALVLMLALPLGSHLVTRQAAAVPQTVSVTTLQTGIPRELVELDGVPVTSAVTLTPRAEAPPPQRSPRNVYLYLTATWLGGVMLLSLRLVGNLWLLGKIRRRGTRVAAEVQSLVAILAKRLALTSRVDVLRTTAVDTPAVFGLLKPTLLLPLSVLSGLTLVQLELVIAHELAHVKRRDYLVNLLQTLVETLMFYHPAVWWASRVIRQEREHCCDDLALRVTGGDPRDYALTLQGLERLRQPQLVVSAQGGSLVTRVRRVLGVPTAPSPNWLVGLGVFTACAFFLVAVPQQAQAQGATLNTREVWLTVHPNVRFAPDYRHLAKVRRGAFLILEQWRGTERERWLLVSNPDGEAQYLYAEGHVSVTGLDVNNVILGNTSQRLQVTADKVSSGDAAAFMASAPEASNPAKAWLEETLAEQLAPHVHEPTPTTNGSARVLGQVAAPLETVASGVSGSFSLFLGGNDFGFETNFQTPFSEALLTRMEVGGDLRYRLLGLAAANIGQAEHKWTYHAIGDEDFALFLERTLSLYPELKPELMQAASRLDDGALKDHLAEGFASASDVQKPAVPGAELRRQHEVAVERDKSVSLTRLDEAILTRLNLGFEEVADDFPLRWTGRTGLPFKVVTNTDSYDGVRSVTLRCVEAGCSRDFSAVTSHISATGLAGQTITLTGYLKTAEVKAGFAGLWLRVDGVGKELAFDNMQDRGVTGTTGWTEYSITLPVADGAQEIYFGALLTGEGQLWVDALGLNLSQRP